MLYTADGFVSKNTDTMPEEMTELMLSCEGLAPIRAALQAKADLEAGKAPAAKGGKEAEAHKEEAEKPAAKMSMKEKIAAMQKGAAADDKPAPAARGKVRESPRHEGRKRWEREREPPSF